MMSAILESGGPFPRRAAALVLLLALLVVGGGAALRSVEHDESYSVFVTGGIARPDWPRAVFTPAEAREPFEVHTGPAETARLLRETDVHPPLYFWALGAWRTLAGDGLPALRALSVLFALGAVLAWMAAAWRAGLPPLAVGVAAVLAYGFGYTGGIARGFALAHLLLALAALAAVEAWRAAAAERRGAAFAWAAGAGAAAGLSVFTNYLAVFPAAAVLAWMALAAPDWGARFRAAFAAGLPFLLGLGGAVTFFLAQKDSRPGQFVPFEPLPAALRLARFNAANLFGGLPLYVEGAASAAVGGALALLLAAAAAVVAWTWRRLPAARWLLLGGALAPSAGVLALGAAFGNTPIELRYIAFAAPFAAALVAAAAASWARTAPRAASAGFALVLAASAAGAIGMALHPKTQQPFENALAAAAPRLGEGSVLLVPFADDGVGVTGGLLLAAPPGQNVLVLRNEDAAAAPGRAEAAGSRRAVLVALGERDGAKQSRAAAEAFDADPSWRSLGRFWSDFRGGYAEAWERPAAAQGERPVADRGR